MNTSKFVITLALMGFTLTGCSGAKDSKSDRMPEQSQQQAESPIPDSAEPSAEEQADSHPAMPVHGKQKHETVRVFYGTDRNLTGSTQPKEFFGAERASLSLGFCDVSIPQNHREGKLESPKIWKLEFRENPDKHVVLKSVEPASGPEFLTSLRDTIQNSIEVEQTPAGEVSRGGEAFVFIHGYNNSFEDAARRTAQIAYDLKFKGAPLMYSWPSKAKGTLWAYKEDARTAQWCEENVTLFIEAIAHESGARKIHLIAHSMGNRVLSRALKKISQKLAGSDKTQPLFNEVILTAPDIDAQVFKDSIAPHIVQTANRFTIYSSSDDLALKASRVINSFWHQRLGEGGSYLTVFPKFKQINVVDASDIDTNLFALGHSYHADNVSVLGDVKQVFQGIPVNDRGLRSLLENLAWKFQSKRSLLGRAFRGTFR
ncbi:alpha/beta hydrolase [uncultured Gimesia sp.]|uniref:alpha/beta hydrolase n=1 Tax=uncultured Gimesia sp. TaxID=1678688 RepID=UPI0030D83DDC|tara:strand:+ start:25786 stop:27072 length:1287 start_codon:yes stop_codon:yes gene_type:complete